MRRILLPLLALVMGLSLVNAAPAAAGDIASTIRDRYASLNTFQAEFTQYLKHRESGQQEKRQGTLIFKKPLLVNWQTRAPHAESLIISADEIWDYLPEEKVAYRYPHSLVDDSRSLIQIVTGQALLSKDFDVKDGGTQGALKIARYFEEQGIAFDAVYDEGGIIIAPGLGGIQRTAALVGTAEKGFSTIRITVRGTGGHSSMPPEKGSLVLAAEIIEMLNQERMPAFLTAPVIAFLDRIGGSMGVAQRTAIANRWLLESPLLRSFESNPATNALVRTTTAITMARGSDAANVLASEAEVTVNFRLLPGNTTAQVKRHVENICNGYDVRIEELSTREPSQISPDDVHAFEMIRTSLAGLYPGTIVTPYLTLGGTDAYKYEAVSPNVYRFMPVLLTEQEQGTIHNENESISLENYGRMIAYFRDLIRNYR